MGHHNITKQDLKVWLTNAVDATLPTELAGMHVMINLMSTMHTLTNTNDTQAPIIRENPVFGLFSSHQATPEHALESNTEPTRTKTI